MSKFKRATKQVVEEEPGTEVKRKVEEIVINYGDADPITLVDDTP